jgi:hypothetical protein
MADGLGYKQQPQICGLIIPFKSPSKAHKKTIQEPNEKPGDEAPG